MKQESFKMGSVSEAERESVDHENNVKDIEETEFVEQLIYIADRHLLCSVRGTDGDNLAYFNVVLEPEKVEDFLHAAATGRLDVALFGTIIASGFGENPTKVGEFYTCFKDFMIFTGFTNRFHGAWYYLEVKNRENFSKPNIKHILNNFLMPMLPVSNTLPPHLKILHSGWGHDPPESITRVMLLTYFGERNEFGVENRIFLSNRLHRYARCRQSEFFTIAKFQHDRIDLSKIKSDKNGWTVLHHAAFGGDSRIVQFLIENGADVYAKDSICGRSPIHIAAREGSVAVIKLFLCSGASINEVDKIGWTPLHYAAWAGHRETVELLINEGATIDAKDILERLMPIHLGAREGHIEVVKFFLAEGMFVDEVDRYGRTPLYYAACRGQLEISEYLVENGAYMHAETSSHLKYKKPIHVAAANKHINVIEFFLNKHVSVNDPCRNGFTPLHWAARCGLEDTVRFLLKKGADIESETISLD